MLSGYNDLKQNISQRAPWIFAALGFFYYAASLWRAALTQISVLDEGLYLFKGLLFSSGVFKPFQPYGPWTNQMPFAFYIPGWLQQVFGPSLASGRAAAVVFGLLTYIGFALTLRKFANWKITSVLLIFLAINSAQTKMIAIATSQGLIACLITWSIYFLLGNKRKAWQLFLSGVFAGLTVMIRINMIPILPLILLFALWQHGWKPALWNALGIAVFFIGGHAILWPEILQIWAKWIPLPFLSHWFAPKTIPTWQPDNPLGFRVASFFLGFRYHFAALAGGFLSLFWVDQPSLKQNGYWKTYLFLYISFVVLFLIHLWAALLNDYCVFCFPTYITFFSNIGLILLAISFTHLSQHGGAKVIGSALSLTAILAGIAYSAEDVFSEAFGTTIYRSILNLQVPFSNASLWQVIANKFTLEQSALVKITNSAFPTLLTSFFIILILFTWAFIKKFSPSMRTKSSFGAVLFVFITTSALTPTKPLAGGYNTYDCDSSVMWNYDRISADISALIPKGASVYWAGYSPVTLLHAPQAVIYPAQLHAGYSYRISDESDALLQYGWWNKDLSEKWAQESDLILVEAKNLSDVALISNEFADFDMIYRSEPQNCRQNSEMQLFRRKP